MSTVHGEREGRGGSTLVCAQVERAGSVYAQQAEAVQIRRPAEDACACEEEDAEGEGKGDDKRRVVQSIVHVHGCRNMRVVTEFGNH